MSERPFTREEIQMMSEINVAVQRLNFIDKAKTVGFIAGLAAQASKQPKPFSKQTPIPAKQGATV